jgi:hypothetical protein
MAIASYEELSTFGKILYAVFRESKTIEAETVNLAATQSKITAAEKTFILG